MCGALGREIRCSNCTCSCAADTWTPRRMGPHVSGTTARTVILRIRLGADSVGDGRRRSGRQTARRTRRAPTPHRDFSPVPGRSTFLFPHFSGASNVYQACRPARIRPSASAYAGVAGGTNSPVVATSPVVRGQRHHIRLVELSTCAYVLPKQTPRSVCIFSKKN